MFQKRWPEETKTEGPTYFNTLLQDGTKSNLYLSLSSWPLNVVKTTNPTKLAKLPKYTITFSNNGQNGYNSAKVLHFNVRALYHYSSCLYLCMVVSHDHLHSGSQAVT